KHIRSWLKDRYRQKQALPYLIDYFGATHLAVSEAVREEYYPWLINGPVRSSTCLAGKTDRNRSIVAVGNLIDQSGPDILWQRRSDGQLEVWRIRNQRPESRFRLTLAMDRQWYIAGQADLNGDGIAELLFRRKSDGRVDSWAIRGGTVARLKTLAETTDPAWDIAGAGDFNDDGHTDILWARKSDNLIRVWTMRGARLIRSEDFQKAAGRGWCVVGVADLNRDGYDDLIFRRSSDQSAPIYIWFLKGAAAVTSSYLVKTPSPHWELVGM
ncbi:unnamed protein product, partial [marine sediment metagenome]